MTAALVGTNHSTLRRGLATNVARLVVGLPVSLLVLPIVFTRLSPRQYGVWAVMSSLLAVAGLADGGIRAEAVRRVADGIGRDDFAAARRSASEGFTLLCLAGIIVAAAGWVISPSLVNFVFDAHPIQVQHEDTVLLLRGVLLVLGLSLASNGYFAVLPGVQRADFENLGALLAVVVGGATTVGLVYAGAGVWALFWGGAAQVVAAGAVQLRGMLTLPATLRPTLARLKGARARGYIGLSALLLFSQISNVVDFEFDKVVLARYVDASASAQYDIGTTAVLQTRMFTLIPLGIALAGLAELLRSDARSADRLLTAVRSSVLALTGLTMGLLFLFGPALVHLWLGNGFSRAGTATRLLAVAMAANAVAAPAAYFAIANAWHRLAAIGAAVNIVVNASVSLALVLTYGFEGALWGSIAGNASATVVFLCILSGRDRRAALHGLARPVAFTIVVVGVSYGAGLGAATRSLLEMALIVPAWVVGVAALMLCTHVVDPRSVAWLLRRGLPRVKPRVVPTGSLDA